MKHSTFFKQGYILAFIVIVLYILSCSKRDLDTPIGPDLKKSAAMLGNESAFDEFKPLLEGVAKYVAEKQATLSRQVMREEKDKTFLLSELFPEKSAIVSQVGSDGTPYEIGIEFSARSKFTDVPARVALDPDRFYPNGNSFIAFVLDNKGEIISENIEKSVTELDFPLVFVTLEDRTEIPFADIGKGERKAQFMKNAGGAQLTSTTYLTISYVDLHTDHDPSTNEEFEIFIRVGSGSTDPIYNTTNHKFDGGSRNDAAGNYQYYPDINSTSSYEISDITLWQLSSTPIAIAMIEDDHTAGKYISDCCGSPQTIVYAQEYRHDVGTVYTNVDRYHNVWGYTDWYWEKEDDHWTSGMFSNFTESNAPPSPTLFNQLNDFGVELWKVDYSPPATAPNVTGGTSGVHPSLSWSAVSGATGYKIYRSIGGNPYSQLYTTPSLSFTDLTREVPTGASTLSTK